MYSPLGNNADSIMSALHSEKSAVAVLPELAEYKNMSTTLGAPVTCPLPDYPRKKVRAMGRIGKLAVAAAGDAIKNAGLEGSSELTNGATGIACGSCSGTYQGMQDVANFVNEKDTVNLNATTYVQIMPHSVAVNLSIFYGISGRIIATSTACTSGSQAIGYAYETIQEGRQLLMLAGGAEELSPISIGVFDALFATSQTKDPTKAPKPFDAKRDGIVVGEGAGMLILEELSHAESRGAKILAEIVGFATNSDATHITNPSSEGMEKCMRLALDNAGLKPEDIGYINAHGTGTINGDIAEGTAMYRVFGNKVPVSTLKSYMGHTLGAAGALEAEMSILMQREGWFAPNLNLETPDSAFLDLDLVRSPGIVRDAEYVMTNNFAFGGVNTSIIIKKVAS